MNPSLSVVVPIHNVQSTLAGTVEELLEIVPELTPLFEVLLVDDCSTDATRDVANELSLGYPQVQVIAQSRRLGPQDSLRSALRFTQGEYVLHCTDRPAFDLHDLRKLWNRKQSNGAVWGRCPTPSMLGSIPQPPSGLPSAGGESPLPDLLLVPRRLLAVWQGSNERQSVLIHLRERGYPVLGTELRRRSFGGSVRSTANEMRQVARFSLPAVQRVSRSTVDPVAPPQQRPNLLLSMNRSVARGK